MHSLLVAASPRHEPASKFPSFRASHPRDAFAFRIVYFTQGLEYDAFVQSRFRKSCQKMGLAEEPVRSIIGLCAATAGSVAFQMSVDAGWFRGFGWAVPWAWALCIALWAFWGMSHPRVTNGKLRTFHTRLGRGVHFLRIGLSLVVFVLSGTVIRSIADSPRQQPRTSNSEQATQLSESPTSTKEVSAAPVPKILPTNGKPKHVKKQPRTSPMTTLQSNGGGSDNTNTRITSPQAPIAIAPNGIANTAPNLGTQTVTNFGEMPSPPLQLTDEQCQSITDALAPYKSQTVAVIAQGYMGGDPFTSKLRGCIEAAGLTVHYEAVGIFSSNFGTPPPGISFMLGDQRKDILQTLANTFWTIGLVNKRIKAFDTGNNDGFTIFVSPLP
jgi:hypothetical protein